MASERDPRFSPVPGDVVIFGPQWQQERYEVVGFDGQVHYLMGETPLICSLADWRKWARNAEVIQRGDEHGK